MPNVATAIEILTEFSDWLDSENLKRKDGGITGMTLDPITEYPRFDKRSSLELVKDFLDQRNSSNNSQDLLFLL